MQYDTMNKNKSEYNKCVFYKEWEMEWIQIGGEES